MRILIIGGTGNISTPLTRTLQKEHQVLLFNNDTERPGWLSRDVEVVTGDRKDHCDFEKKANGLGTFDCVIDMIAFEPQDAESDVRVFSGKTEQFIFCSTVDVYPKEAKKYPIKETDEIGASPRFPYAFKKVQCEETLWAAHRSGHFHLTVLRPTFTYNESWSPGIHSFGGQSYHLDRIRRGRPIIMHGDGNGVWVATHRDDTARAFASAAGNLRTFGQAYNISPDEWMTHNHIWRTIAGLMGAPEPDFVYIPSELLGKIAPKEAEWCVENFRYNNIFDNSKAKRDLGYTVTVPFKQGAKRCIDYLIEHNLIENCDHYPFYDRIVHEWRRLERQMMAQIQQINSGGSS